MKKLIAINNLSWIFIASIFLLSSLILFFFLNARVSSTSTGVATLGGDSKKVLYVDMNFAYKIKEGNVISFKIGNDFYSAIVDHVHWDETKGQFALDISCDNSIPFFKGSSLQVSIIYDTHKVIDGLLGSV